MLRAVRFAAKLDMKISPETAEPIPRLATLLQEIPPARLFEESLKRSEMRIGEVITNDEDSYRYLAESIRMHPGQEALQKLMEQAGLENVKYYNLTMGVVALHCGFKY